MAQLTVSDEWGLLLEPPIQVEDIMESFNDDCSGSDSSSTESSDNEYFTPFSENEYLTAPESPYSSEEDEPFYDTVTGDTSSSNAPEPELPPFSREVSVLEKCSSQAAEPIYDTLTGETSSNAAEPKFPSISAKVSELEKGSLEAGEPIYDTLTGETSSSAAEPKLLPISGEVSEFEKDTSVIISPLTLIIQYQCTKLCGNGRGGVHHSCSSPNHHPDEPCPPCPKPLELVQLDCGHPYVVRCGNRFIAKPICKRPCSKITPCRHECPKLCYEKCEPCKLWIYRTYADCLHSKWQPCAADGTEVDICTVPLVSTLNCPAEGHGPVNTICQMNKWAVRYKDREILRKYCERTCDMEYTKEDNGCGHLCQGTCKNNDCNKGRLHQRCQERCGKVQVCGHECDFLCSAGCGPCIKECNFHCAHGKCSLPCGEPCATCLKPCAYKCPHYACTNLCGEPCNKPPCKFPCRKKLPCGHPCIGFCGEVCPTLCRVCNADELILGLFMTSDNVAPTDKFIYLEMCGHAIESEFMNTWMNSFSENDEVVLKQCPFCRQPIYYLPRYSNILWKIHQDINIVKSKIRGTQTEIGKIRDEIAQAIQSATTGRHITHFRSIGRYLVSNYRNSLKFNKRGMVSLLGFTKVWANIVELVETDELYKTFPERLQVKFVEEYETFFTLMASRPLPFANTEIADFNREIIRLEDFIRFFKFIHMEKETWSLVERIPLALKVYNKTCSLLVRHGPWTVDRRNEFQKKFDEIKKWTHNSVGISEPERISILQAFGLTTGRWFKCRNGHPYLVTECGGVMQEAKCNECGAEIGGNQHRLREDNSWAPEVDGATEPAYPYDENFVGFDDPDP